MGFRGFEVYGPSMENSGEDNGNYYTYWGMHWDSIRLYEDYVGYIGEWKENWNYYSEFRVWPYYPLNGN